MRQDAEVGAVYKVDTLTMKVVDKVTVGYQPDELAVVHGKLYVANSGGYRNPNYDRTVSVIDLKTFKEERKIDVAINLHVPTVGDVYLRYFLASISICHLYLIGTVDDHPQFGAIYLDIITYITQFLNLVRITL